MPEWHLYTRFKFNQFRERRCEHGYKFCFCLFLFFSKLYPEMRNLLFYTCVLLKKKKMKLRDPVMCLDVFKENLTAGGDLELNLL